MSQENVETLGAVYERCGRGDFWRPDPARGRVRGSGLETETRFAHVWTMRAGKATSIAAYTNRGEARKAVGLEG
jgi:hypothetical protein